MSQKKIIAKHFQALEKPATAAVVMAAHLADNFTWHGPQPFQSCHSFQQWLSSFWQPLTNAFSDLRRETHMLVGGDSHGKADNSFDGRYWVGATGYYCATFSREWLGLPPTGQPVRLRWGDFFRFEDNLIVESYTLIDIVDFLQQIGRNPLPPSRGIDFVYPPPTAIEGVQLGDSAAAKTDLSMNLIRDFLFDGLNNFDQQSLSSMGVDEFFHSNVKWYGPGGIGACLSLAEFQQYHQQPWLEAYPDRLVQDLDSLFADGDFVASSAWAGVKAKHLGRYLNVEATDNNVTFNGMDFWLRRDDKFVENWVFVDMLDLFQQFGVDLLQNAREI
ncbi:MAG: ester cyclase [Porticoccaceae bacterium]|nr:ester cyclase [Porticoccaceae bacterium]